MRSDGFSVRCKPGVTSLGHENPSLHVVGTGSLRGCGEPAGVLPRALARIAELSGSSIKPQLATPDVSTEEP